MAWMLLAYRRKVCCHQLLLTTPPLAMTGHQGGQERSHECLQPKGTQWPRPWLRCTA